MFLPESPCGVVTRHPSLGIVKPSCTLNYKKAVDSAGVTSTLGSLLSRPPRQPRMARPHWVLALQSKGQLLVAQSWQQPSDCRFVRYLLLHQEVAA